MLSNGCAEEAHIRSVLINPFRSKDSDWFRRSISLCATLSSRFVWLPSRKRTLSVCLGLPLPSSSGLFPSARWQPAIQILNLIINWMGAAKGWRLILRGSSLNEYREGGGTHQELSAPESLVYICEPGHSEASCSFQLLISILRIFGSSCYISDVVKGVCDWVCSTCSHSEFLVAASKTCLAGINYSLTH